MTAGNIINVKVLSDKKVLVFTDVGEASRGCQRRLKDDCFTFGGVVYELTPGGLSWVSKATLEGKSDG